MIRILIADDHAIVRAGLKQFIVDQPDMQIAGEAATGSETQMVFSITLDDSGRLKADGAPIGDDDELRRAAQAALAKTSDVRTVVQASTVVPHGKVIHVLDELRLAGIQKIAFGVDPELVRQQTGSGAMP